jgi:hypothetical protein
MPDYLGYRPEPGPTHHERLVKHRELPSDVVRRFRKHLQHKTPTIASVSNAVDATVAHFIPITNFDDRISHPLTAVYNRKGNCRAMTGLASALVSPYQQFTRYVDISPIKNENTQPPMPQQPQIRGSHLSLVLVDLDQEKSSRIDPMLYRTLDAFCELTSTETGKVLANTEGDPNRVIAVYGKDDEVKQLDIPTSGESFDFDPVGIDRLLVPVQSRLGELVLTRKGVAISLVKYGALPLGDAHV